MTARGWSAADLPWWHQRVPEHKMPLNLHAVYCAARLIGDRPVGTGQTERGTIGTGFFVTLPSEKHKTVRYMHLLTANHVVEGQSNVEVQVPNPANGELQEPLRIEEWWHPVESYDLAIAPINLQKLGLHPLAIRLDQFVSRTEETGPFPGSIIYYIGQLSVRVPTGQATSERLDRTLVRVGTIGALDQEGIPLQEYDYPVHLVDCRSYRGFSGSPCFVESAFAILKPTEAEIEPPPEMEPLGDLAHMTELCGMFTSHFDAENADGAASRLGIGIMLRSEEIREALVNDDLRKMRAEEDEHIAESYDVQIEGLGTTSEARSASRPAKNSTASRR